MDVAAGADKDREVPAAFDLELQRVTTDVGNLLRRWVQEAEMKPGSKVVRAHVVDGAEAQKPKTVFLPVSLPASTPPVQAPNIRIELQRGPTVVTVT
ncbi:MAG: hypothetical protein ACK4OH_03450 [Acidovorax temperans]